MISINRMLLYLKPEQKWDLVAFSGLMILDFAITAYGFLLYPNFSEANAVFARFYASPLVFLGIIAVSKTIVITGIIVAVIWFNKKEKQDEKYHGGNIISFGAMVVMLCMLSGLGLFNLLNLL